MANTGKETQNDDSGSSGTSKKTLYIIGGIIAAVVVIALILFFLWPHIFGSSAKTELHGSYDSKVNLVDPNVQGKYINSAFVQH